MPIDLGGRHALNIFKVRYRSAHNGRVVELWVKAPTSTGPLDMAEMLARQQAKGQIWWYRVDVAKPHEIAAHRTELARPRDALRASSLVTRVDWSL